jgi:hypothetical protein
MKPAADLLSAIGTLLWPIFAFVVLLMYRKQLETLFDRFKRGKILGQELELEAPRLLDVRPLASQIVIDNLDALLESPTFKKKIATIVATSVSGGNDTVTSEVLKAVQDAASQQVKTAFIQIDTRPLLGRFGKTWDEPYEEDFPVWRFLDGIWDEMNTGTKLFVKPYRYPDGWLLRERATGRLFTDIGRAWAKKNGVRDDARRLTEVGIQPGAVFDVVPGPKADDAIALPK